MKELIENIRGGLDVWGELTEVGLNAFSLICIIAGIIISIARSIRERQLRPGAHPMHTNFRRLFGGWLVVALEVQLAADIVGTIVSPTNEHLIELGAIAVIRTFLNYFLSKELNEEKEAARPEMEKVKERPPEKSIYKTT